VFFKNNYKWFFGSAVDGADVDGSVYEFFVYGASYFIAPGGEGRLYISTGLNCRDVFGKVFDCLFLAQQPPDGPGPPHS
jgi:hypothetical protein